MKQNHAKGILLWILAGAAIGSGIGILGVTGIIPGEQLMRVTGLTVHICIGLIVLLIDSLCIWALVRRQILAAVERSGASAAGTVTAVREIPHPGYLTDDDWVRKARFVFTVTYQAENKTYTKEFPPTALLSRQTLYPVLAEPGCSLPVRYSRKHPRFSLIDVNVMIQALKHEQRTTARFFVIIPIVLTTLYILICKGI